MRVLIVLVLLNLALCPECLPSGDQDLQAAAERLVERARTLAEIENKPSPLLLVTADFSVRADPDERYEGKYQLVFKNPDRWRKQLVIPRVYIEDWGENEKHRWRLRQPSCRPEQVSLLLDSIDIAERLRFKTAETGVKKIKNEEVDGTPASCLLLAHPTEQYSVRKLCFDRETGALVLIEGRRFGFKETTRYFYDGALACGERCLPSKLSISRSGKEVLKVDTIGISKLENAPAGIFTPPEGAEITDICGAFEPPRKTKHANPVYPPGLLGKQIGSYVILCVDIGIDGSVKNMKPARKSGHPEFNESAMDAVSSWRYRPALCDGVPVEETLTVRVSFDPR